MGKRLLAYFIVFGTIFGLSVAQASETDPENLIYMDLKGGRVVIQLYPAFAPEAVNRIKTLTREGFYNGLTFHRVLEGFMVQTGDPKGDGTGGSKYPNLPDEFSVKPHWRGTTSMANSGTADSSNSQFFIMLGDNPNLDGKYTVWGRVVEGMIHVDNIKKGDPYADGKIIGVPDRILKMQVAADVMEPVNAASSATATQ